MQNRRTKQKQKQKAYRQKHINHNENQSYAHINHPDLNHYILQMRVIMRSAKVILERRKKNYRNERQAN